MDGFAFLCLFSTLGAVLWRQAFFFVDEAVVAVLLYVDIEALK